MFVGQILAFLALVASAWANVEVQTKPVEYTLKDAMEARTVNERVRIMKKVAQTPVSPRAGVAPLKDAKDSKVLDHIHANAPQHVQEEEIRRNLRQTYTRIPNPFEYDYANQGQFTEVTNYYDDICTDLASVIGVANNLCSTMYNIPGHRVMYSTVEANNGSHHFYYPSYTIHNDSSCVDPWISVPLTYMALNASCAYQSYTGYYSTVTLRNYVPNKPRNGLLIRSHPYKWQCLNKKTTENLEYKIIPLNTCTYDPIHDGYFKVASCDKNTHTATLVYYDGYFCFGAENSQVTRVNTEDCATSNSMNAFSRGFFSYTCI